MGPLVEKILISIMRKILNEEVVAKAKVELIAFLRELALKSDNKLDDAMVDIIEEALNAAPAIPA